MHTLEQLAPLSLQLSTLALRLASGDATMAFPDDVMVTAIETGIARHFGNRSYPGRDWIEVHVGEYRPYGISHPVGRVIHPLRPNDTNTRHVKIMVTGEPEQKKKYRFALDDELNLTMWDDSYPTPDILRLVSGINTASANYQFQPLSR